jgi:hypothetical protein
MANCNSLKIIAEITKVNIHCAQQAIVHALFWYVIEDNDNFSLLYIYLHDHSVRVINTAKNKLFYDSETAHYVMMHLQNEDNIDNSHRVENQDQMWPWETSQIGSKAKLKLCIVSVNT